MRRLILGGLLIGLVGCDAGPRAVPLHDGDGKAPVAESKKAPVWADKTAGNNMEEASMAVPDASAPTPESHNLAAAGNLPPLPVPNQRGAVTASHYGDWPLWSSSSKYSADDNAHYQFGKHGGEIGAASYEAYVAAVHAFIHTPPAGTETVRRKNGDTLLYNSRQNIFAVMTKDGAPRTLFRPDDGAAYWAKQKQIEAGKDANTE